MKGLLNQRVTLLVVGLAWAGGAAIAAELPFPTATVDYHTLVVERSFEGVVEPVHQSTVSSQTTGRIIEINFDVDDVVPKGSVLLRLHDTEQRARLEEAKAGAVDAEARLVRARDEHARIQNLFDRKLASQADLDRVQTDLRSAMAALDMAKARVTQAQEQMDYTVVRAPYGGVVVARHVQLGETVQVGQALMTGFSLEQLRVTTSVPQDFVYTLRERGRARVLLLPGQAGISSAALTVFPYADKQSHAFKVWVGLPEGQQRVYPGMFAKVAFEVGEEKRLMLPVAAVAQRSEVTGVYVVTPEGKLVFRQVLRGAPREDMVEVLAGLDAGERVALDPVAAGTFLKDGGR